MSVANTVVEIEDEYHFITPAEGLAFSFTVPESQFEPGVVEVIVGTVNIFAMISVLVALLQPLLFPSTQ